MGAKVLFTYLMIHETGFPLAICSTPPNLKTLIGKRDRVILALLIGCELRRAELLRLDVDHPQQRDARWIIPHLPGKGNRIQTVSIPGGVKARIDLWTTAARISGGQLFLPVTKAGMVLGRAIQDEKTIWRLVVRYAQETELGKLAPHDVRRTRAKLCRKAGGDLEQTQLLLGHAPVLTTERCLGTEQALAHALNDNSYTCINNGRYAFNNLQMFDETSYHKFGPT